MIKYILWDIDGTLLNFQLAEEISIRRGFSEFSLGECSDEMLRDYSNINVSFWKRLERGEISKPDVLVGRFFEFFKRYLIDTSKVEDFNRFYQESLGTISAFNPNGKDVVESLRGEFKQYAVTNGTITAQKGKLRNSGLDKIFDDIFISDEIGIEKPNIGFFDFVFEKIGSWEKDEFIIIGDSLSSDIQGGVNAGIKTVWFNPSEKENTSGLEIDFIIKDLKGVLDILK